MSTLNAIILGVVQGITEFLPVSSSGHISMICNLFKIEDLKTAHPLLDAFLHLGTAVAVTVMYWQDIRNMVYELTDLVRSGGSDSGKRYPRVREFLMVLSASLPLLILIPVRIFFTPLYYSNIFIAFTLFLTGLVVFVASKIFQGEKTARNISFWDAVIVGLCQLTAIIPGMSRAAVSLTAGIATGMRRDYAVRFSLLLSIPTLFGYGLVNMFEALGNGFSFSDMPAYLFGTAFSVLAGIGTITLLKHLVKNNKFKGFAYYCWFFGAMSVILTLIF